MIQYQAAHYKLKSYYRTCNLECCLPQKCIQNHPSLNNGTLNRCVFHGPYCIIGDNCIFSTSEEFVELLNWTIILVNNVCDHIFHFHVSLRTYVQLDCLQWDWCSIIDIKNADFHFKSEKSFSAAQFCTTKLCSLCFMFL